MPSLQDIHTSSSYQKNVLRDNISRARDFIADRTGLMSNTYGALTVLISCLYHDIDDAKGIERRQLNETYGFVWNGEPSHKPGNTPHEDG